MDRQKFIYTTNEEFGCPIAYMEYTRGGEARTKKGAQDLPPKTKLENT